MRGSEEYKSICNDIDSLHKEISQLQKKFSDFHLLGLDTNKIPKKDGWLYTANSCHHGRYAGELMAQLGGQKNKEATDLINNMTKGGHLAKAAQVEKFKSSPATNDKLANRQDRKEKTGKSDFRTTRGLTKESVDDLKMDIYESERYGEISIEERDELLSYLD